MKTTTSKSILGLLALSLLSVGCATTSPVDENWGAAQRSAREGMIANPDAGQDTQPVEGMAAATADDVTEYYHERQKLDHQNGDRSSVLEQLDN
jgi:hypothetical protein